MKFGLFLRGEPAGVTSIRNLGPEEMQRSVAEFRAWMGAHASKIVMGEKLGDEGGRRLERDGKSERIVVTDGPYTEAKDVLGGFFVVEAASYDEAVEIARGCPHLRFGPIEVRAVDDMRG